MLKLMLIVTLVGVGGLTFLGAPMANQRDTTNAIIPFPGKILLLPGYKIEARNGMEYPYGKIWKDGGPTINFQVGGQVRSREVDFRDQLEMEGGVSWRQQQTVNGHQVICVYTKSNNLIIMFPYLSANFTAAVGRSQDITDMLLMALTFERPELPPEPKSPK
jgi:hypothetical protein